MTSVFHQIIPLAIFPAYSLVERLLAGAPQDTGDDRLGRRAERLLLGSPRASASGAKLTGCFMHVMAASRPGRLCMPVVSSSSLAFTE